MNLNGSRLGLVGARRKSLSGTRPHVEGGGRGRVVVECVIGIAALDEV